MMVVHLYKCIHAQNHLQLNVQTDIVHVLIVTSQNNDICFKPDVLHFVRVPPTINYPHTNLKSTNKINVTNKFTYT